MAILCDICKGIEKVLPVVVGWMESPVSSFHDYGQLDLCVKCRACVQARQRTPVPRSSVGVLRRGGPRQGRRCGRRKPKARGAG